jgi:5-methylcytosine-specific restriction endonuclease McrA
MRIELVVLLIAGLVAFNIYTEGKYTKMVMGYKKYWQIAAVVFGAVVLCWMLRRDPSKARDMLESTQSYLKYMPIDSRTSGFLSPILDFTAKRTFANDLQQQQQRPVVELDGGSNNGGSLDGGGSMKRVKRSVSETKKKYVAARQKWLCNDCGAMLTATYEIDHIIRLDRGGSNHIDNLAALCPNCHRQKTMIENL